MTDDNGNHAATPGPWLDGKPNLTDGPSTESGSHVIYSGRREIARVYGDKGLPVKANAQLIAAAPDLLEALGSIINEFAEDKADQDMCADPHTLGRINRARAAIAKAKGD